MEDSLGDRMKKYENTFRYGLPPKLPTIIRVDGKAFHTLCKHADKPFDEDIEWLMEQTATYLCKNIQTCKLAYFQSDEISLLLHPYERFNTDAWFDGNIQKMVSIAGSLASASFNEAARLLFAEDDNIGCFSQKFGEKFPVIFDARVFTLAEHEVNNYFLWRQRDATRNSISSVAQSLFDHKELDKKNSSQKQEMIFSKGLNWNDLSTRRKRGACIVHKQIEVSSEVFRNKWLIDAEIPIFSEDKDYIKKHFGFVQTDL